MTDDTKNNQYGEHFSVLNEECLQIMTEGISKDDSAVFADLTFGAGGHSFNVRADRHFFISL